MDVVILIYRSVSRCTCLYLRVSVYISSYVCNYNVCERATIPVPKGAYDDFGEMHGLENACVIDIDSDIDLYIVICIYRTMSKCIYLYI